MGIERKIEALKEATERKSQEALDKTNKAITQLLKEGKRISFPVVAKAAGVSVQYLYKYEDIKNRIKHLQEQQKGVSSPSTPQVASDKSRTVMIAQLKERIRKLEVENRGLRNHIEAVSGRLYQLQGIEEQLEKFRAENNDLKRQLDKCRHCDTEPLTTPPDNPKVASLDQKKSERSDISDKIKQTLAELGIKLSSTLTKTIKSASEEIVVNAIEAFKEAMVSDNIEKPGAWLKSAIENGWHKNEPSSCETATRTTNEFSEWFELAKAQGVAQSRQETEEGPMVQDTTGHWMSWESFVERGWTLEYLKKRAKAR